MGIQIECEECGRDLDKSFDIFCGRCFVELEDKVSDLEKEVRRLNSDIASLEKEFAAKE